MKTYKKGICFVLSAALCLALSLFAFGCGEKGSALKINVPAETVKAELGSYALPSYDVVDETGTIMSGYTVKVKSITDPAGEAVEALYNQITVSAPGLWKITYTAEGPRKVSDAVLTLDFADRVAPGVTFSGTVPDFFIRGNTYQVPEYAISGEPLMGNCYHKVYYRATDDAERVEVRTTGANAYFTVGESSGFYDIVIHVEDAAGNADDVVTTVPVDGPAQVRPGQILYLNDPFGLRQISVPSTAKAEYLTGAEHAAYIKPGDTGVTSLTVSGEAAPEITFRYPAVTDISDYNYFYLDIYNANDELAVCQYGWDGGIGLRPGEWTRIGYTQAAFERIRRDTQRNALISDTGIIRADDITGLKIQLCAPDYKNLPDGATFYVSGMYACDEPPLESDLSAVTDEKQIYAFDTPAGVEHLYNFTSGTVDSFAVSFDESVKDPDYGLKLGTTKFTLNEDTADFYDKLALCNPLVYDFTDYGAAALRVYNPNDYTVKVGYTWGGDTPVPAKSWTTAVFSLDHIKTQFARSILFGRTLDRLNFRVMNLKQNDSLYLGGAYAIENDKIVTNVPAGRVEKSVEADGSFEFPNYTMRVSDTAGYGAAGKNLPGVGYTLTELKHGGRDVTFDKNNIAVIASGGEYEATYETVQTGFDKIVTVVYDMTIFTITPNEDEIFVFDSPEGIYCTTYPQGDVYALEFAETVPGTEYTDMTKVSFTGSGYNDYDFWAWTYPQAGSVEKYPYVKFFVYNPNDFEMRVGMLWKCDVTIPAKTGKWVIWSARDMLTQEVGSETGNDLNGFRLRVMFVDKSSGKNDLKAMPADSAVYIGGVYGVKPADVKLVPAAESTDVLSFGTPYTPALPGIQVKIGGEYLAPTNVKTPPAAVTVKSVVKGDKTLAVTDNAVAFPEAGAYTVTYGFFEGVPDVTATIVVSMPATLYPNCIVYADEPVGVSQLTRVTGSYTSEYSTEQKFAGEAGSLKITAGDANEFAVKISNPHLKDLSAYKYLVLNVYNASAKATRFGCYWYAPARLAPGEWTTVAIPTDVFGYTFRKDGKEMKYIFDCSLTDITGFTLRFRDHTAGAAYYLGSVYGTNEFGFALPAEKADRFFGFDDAAGVNHINAVNGTGVDFTAEFCPTIEGTEYTNMTKLTYKAAGTDLYNVMQFVLPQGTNVEDYDGVQFTVYNPNDFDIKVGYLWGGDTVVAAGQRVTIQWAIGDRVAVQDRNKWPVNASNDKVPPTLHGLDFRVFGAGRSLAGVSLYIGGFYGYKAA